MTVDPSCANTIGAGGVGEVGVGDLRAWDGVGDRVSDDIDTWSSVCNKKAWLKGGREEFRSGGDGELRLEDDWEGDREKRSVDDRDERWEGGREGRLEEDDVSDDVNSGSGVCDERGARLGRERGGVGDDPPAICSFRRSSSWPKLHH